MWNWRDLVAELTYTHQLDWLSWVCFIRRFSIANKKTHARVFHESFGVNWVHSCKTVPPQLRLALVFVFLTQAIQKKTWFNKIDFEKASTGKIASEKHRKLCYLRCNHTPVRMIDHQGLAAINRHVTRVRMLPALSFSPVDSREEFSPAPPRYES